MTRSAVFFYFHSLHHPLFDSCLVYWLLVQAADFYYKLQFQVLPKRYHLDMQVNQESIDGNFISRYLHLHCFVHIYRVLKGTNPSDYFSKPRFQLFKRIERFYRSSEDTALFKNLIFTFMQEIIIGIIVTLISASLNLVVPELIRQFMHFMRQTHQQGDHNSDFIFKFILIQCLRIFFSQHSKRLFHELAIKVQSTLARKLISKSLRMAKECRDRIPQSEIIQLQNVDLKLIFNLFKNMNVIFQAPFTIIVALSLLFNQSSHYGFIGFYWILIAFLLQRQLDGRMTHCNQTKLKLIEQRSSLNYDLFDKIKTAKLIGWQDILIQKNNDLFIEQNHDHDQFYFYSTLYDITLLMLPIFVVSTITLYDVNEEDPITVQQVYLILFLLSICYLPMKSLKMISINLHDGMHSLSRISKYFHFPQELKSTLVERNTGQPGSIDISEGTEAMNSHSTFDFNIHVPQGIILQPGERLCLLGKKYSGCSSFLEMLVGSMKRVRGKIHINGKISFMPQKLFFLKDTVKQNIRFFNQKITNAEIEQIYNDFGLNIDLRNTGQLKTVIEDNHKFTKTVLKKIALARCLSADADIFILDNPWGQMDEQYSQLVERRLRELQDKKKTVIISLKFLQYIDQNDQIAILQEGRVIQVGNFNDLVNQVDSRINNFFRLNTDNQDFLQPQTGRVQLRFMQRMKSARNFEIKSAVPFKKIPPRIRQQQTGGIRAGGFYRGDYVPNEVMPEGQKFESLVMKFLTSVSFKQSIFIFLIILTAEVLHIFIHFYIGHLEEQYGNQDYTKYKNLMIAQVLLTFCLAGLIYLQGEISTIIAIAIGNKLYRESFNELTSKSLAWYSNQYSLKLADKYNHDYEQIFIACHSIFGIYKNLVILIATIEFISTNRSKLIAIFIVLASIYYTIFYLFRRIERKIVQHYYDYKYNFVRTLEESVQGAQIFNVCQFKNEALQRAENQYQSLASYKLAASYTTYGLSMVCDILSITLLAIGIKYGIEMKSHSHGQRISVIATSIYLLMNISQVLKTIIWQMLNFQTFFSINLVPFMQVKDIQQPDRHKEEHKTPSTSSIADFNGHKLQINHVILEQVNQLTQYEMLHFSIQEGQIVHIYQKDNRCRDLLMYGLTKNLPMFNEPQHFKGKNSTILLGGVSIKEVSKRSWNQQFGIIADENFYFNASIRDNIKWRFQNYDDDQARRYAEELKLKKQFLHPEDDIMSMKLTSSHAKNSTLIKKIAFLRILLRKPKIVILKDTDEYIESIYITKVLKEQIPKVTIIKISNTIEQCFDASRIIAMQNFVVLQDGAPDEIKEDKFSKIGQEIKDINLRSYTFMRKFSKKSQSKNILAVDV